MGIFAVDVTGRNSTFDEEIMALGRQSSPQPMLTNIFEAIKGF